MSPYVNPDLVLATVAALTDDVIVQERGPGAPGTRLLEFAAFEALVQTIWAAEGQAVPLAVGSLKDLPPDSFPGQAESKASGRVGTVGSLWSERATDSC